MAQESCAIILPQFIAVCVIALSIQNTERNRLGVYMLQKYHKTTHVRCGGNLHWAYDPTYMPNQRINRRNKKPTVKYCLVLHNMEITKNSIGLSRSKGLRVCLTLYNCGFL